MHIWRGFTIWKTSILQSHNIWPFTTDCLCCLITTASQPTCCAPPCVSPTDTGASLLLIGAAPSSCPPRPCRQLQGREHGQVLPWPVLGHLWWKLTTHSFLKRCSCAGLSLCLDSVECSTEEVRVGDLNNLFGLKSLLLSSVSLVTAPGALRQGCCHDDVCHQETHTRKWRPTLSISKFDIKQKGVSAKMIKAEIDLTWVFEKCVRSKQAASTPRTVVVLETLNLKFETSFPLFKCQVFNISFSRRSS